MLYRSIESLSIKERVALLLIVQIGRGTFSNVDRETACMFMETPDVQPPVIPGYIISLIDVSDYLEQGLSVLDEMVH